MTFSSVPFDQIMEWPLHILGKIHLTGHSLFIFFIPYHKIFRFPVTYQYKCSQLREIKTFCFHFEVMLTDSKLLTK